MFEFSISPEGEVHVVLKPHDIKNQLIPSEARQHFLQANKEMLLAMQSCIDSTISRIDEKEEKAAKKSTTKEPTTAKATATKTASGIKTNIEIK